MNIFASTRAVAFAAKLFSAAGLDFANIVNAGDENALKAHITAAVAAGPAVAGQPTAAEVAAVSAENEKALARITELEGQLTAANARQAEIVAALGAAKITFAADAKPEVIGAAIETRISIRAGEELAKRGLRDLPPNTPSANPAAAAKDTKPEGLTGLALVQAAFEAESAANSVRRKA